MSSISTTESSASADLHASAEQVTLTKDQKVSSLKELTDQVSANATIISDFLRSNGHPLPSFERDAPINTIPASAPSDIRAARQALMEAALRTFQLAQGPSEYLSNIAVGVGRPSSVCGITPI